MTIAIGTKVRRAGELGQSPLWAGGHPVIAHNEGRFEGYGENGVDVLGFYAVFGDQGLSYFDDDQLEIVIEVGTRVESLESAGRLTGHIRAFNDGRWPELGQYGVAIEVEVGGGRYEQLLWDGESDELLSYYDADELRVIA